MVVSHESVSVVIPLYNRREEIRRALTSVLRQSRAVDEILVVDDASGDGSAEAVEALGDSRIRVLRHERNQGAAAARNTGIAAARGDWIALLDSDDEWRPDKLAAQFAALARAPDRAAASVTGYEIHDYRRGEARTFLPHPNTARETLVWGCPFGVGSTLLARRQVFAEVGMLDASLRRLEDWDWLMRYVAARSLHIVSEPLTIVHKKTNPDSAHVFAAVGRIRAQHRESWYRHSWVEGRKFDSSLRLEESAAAYYDGNYARAVALALQVLIAYPFRLRVLPLLVRRALGQ